MNILEQMLENCKSGKDKTPEHLKEYKKNTLEWLNKNDASIAYKEIIFLINEIKLIEFLGKKELNEEMDILKELKKNIKNNTYLENGKMYFTIWINIEEL